MEFRLGGGEKTWFLFGSVFIWESRVNPSLGRESLLGKNLYLETFLFGRSLCVFNWGALYLWRARGSLL